ncbi:MAG: GtrA family protein [Pseudomonadota bacterium]
MNPQFQRFLLMGGAMVSLYVGGVWLGTEGAGLPARPVNVFFYCLTTAVAFFVTYRWVFGSDVGKRRALPLYLLWQGVGIGLNALWMETGLRFTGLAPWLIAAIYFVAWPFLSFTVQRRFVFNR